MLLACLAAILLLDLAPATLAAEADLRLPATNEGLPGAGPIVRDGWFQKLWLKRRSAWAKQVKQDQGAVVFLGDSITQGGLGADWVGALRQRLADRALVVNAGVGGQVTWDLRQRLDEVARCRPDAILLLVGSNDAVGALASRADGGMGKWPLLIGATVEEMGYEDAPSAGAAMDLLRHGWELLPGIYDLDFQSVDVGFRPAAPDHLPCIGQGSLNGLWWATGHYRNGILMAPATADALTECILSGKMVASIEPFDPSRLHHSTESCG